MLKHSFAIALLTLGALGWGATLSLAQDPPANPVTAAETAEESGTTTIREQTVYVPYTKLRETFEKEGRGIFLPYEEFQKLWTKARQADTPKARSEAPTGAIITEIESVAEMSADAATVQATVAIDLLREGWQQVPLQLADAAILSATIDGKPARLTFQPKRGYTLMVKNESRDPTAITLELKYAKAITKSPGRNQVSFQAPQAPVNRWRIRIPEPGVKINVQPLIAASEAPLPTTRTTGPDEATEAEDADDDGDKDSDDKDSDDKADADDPASPEDKQPAPPAVEETVLLAFVGVAPSVTIDWAPKAEGAFGLAALASVQANQTWTIQEGVIRSRVQLTYSISRAELTELVIEAPKDHKVARVFDANIRGWDVVEEEGVQVIRAQLFEPARTTQGVTVELERFLDDAMQSEVQAPVVKARDVARQQGVLVVSLVGPLRADPQIRNGLLQLDTAELPNNLKQSRWDLAYRYASLPFDLTLQVEKLEPRIETQELVEAYLQPEQLTLNLTTKYKIERVGVFQLKTTMPDGWQVRSVRGRAVNGAAAAAVDGWQVQGDMTKQLIVNLSKRALGDVGLFVELQKTIDDANLLTPTGDASTISIPLPQAADDALEHSQRRFLLHAPESLRVTPKTVDNAQPAAVEDALRHVASSRDNRFPELRPIQAFTLGRELASLEIEAQRRRPHITVAQLMEARIDSGVVHYTARFEYEILYSGVKTLRIDAPSGVIDELGDQSTQGRAIDPPPEDTPDGYVAWELTAETEFFGKHSVVFQWDRKIDQLEVGKSVTIQAPVLRPRDVDRAWGQVLVAKDETLDVRPDEGTSGLRPIDPRHDVMPETPSEMRDRAARAFEFHEEWQLAIKVTRYELEDVKRTSIESAVVRMVVTRSDQTAVQALYRVRSARQRLVIQLPEDVKPETAFDTQPLRLNGVSVPLERGEQGEYYVPLAGHDTNEPFLLELRYLAPGDHRKLALPTFPNDPAVQKVSLCVYLPRERLLTGVQGPWTDTQQIGLAEALDGDFYAPDDQYLIDRLMEGIPVSSTSSFATDGTLHIFTALRPAADAHLRLTTVNRNVFFGLVFLVVGGLGLLLLMQPAWRKLVGLAGLAAAFVLIGAFLPTVFRQLANEVFASAVLLVILTWGVQIAVAAMFTVSRWASSRANQQATESSTAEEVASTGPEGEPAGGGDSASATAETPFAAQADPKAEGAAGSIQFVDAESAADSNDEAKAEGEADNQAGADATESPEVDSGPPAEDDKDQEGGPNHG